MAGGPLAYSHDYSATVKRDPFMGRESGSDGVSREEALAHVLSHELFFHGLAGMSDWIGESAEEYKYNIDGGGAGAGNLKELLHNAVFSSPACKGICKTLELD